MIFWSLLPTLYPSLSFGVPFLGSMSAGRSASIRYFTPFWMAFLGLGLNEGRVQRSHACRSLSVSKGPVAATALGVRGRRSSQDVTGDARDRSTDRQRDDFDAQDHVACLNNPFTLG